MPEPRAGRAPVARRHGLPSDEATTVMAAVGRTARSHRAPERADKPLVRGSVAVGATAAFGAVVTGSLLAVGPTATQNVADVSQDNLTPLDLTNASQALAMQPETLPAPMHGADDVASP